MATYTVDTDGTSGDYATLSSALPSTLTEDLVLNCSATTGIADDPLGSISIDLDGHSLEINGDFAGTVRDSDAYRIEADGDYDYPLYITFSDTAGGGSVTIKGVQFGTNYRSACRINGIAPVIINCLSYRVSTGTGEGFYSGVDDSVYVNCIAIGMGGDGFWSNEDMYCYNCVAIANAGAGFHQRDYRYLYSKNCYAGGNTSDDYSVATNNPERLVLTTSASSDTTGSSGLQSIAYSTSSGAYFSNVTAGSEDVEISSDSELIGEGTDLSSDGTYAFDYDIVGTTRSSWDIGAFEYVSAGGTTVSVDNASHSHSLDAIVLTQLHNLSVGGMSHSHSIDGVNLTTKILLAVDDLAHSQSLDGVVLTQLHNLTVADLDHSQAIGAVDITQLHNLAVDDLEHTQTIDGVTVTIKGSLIVDSLSHVHALDGVNATQKINVFVDDLAHAHTVDEVTVVYGEAIAVDNLGHAHSLGSVTIEQKHILEVQDLAHAHGLDAVSFGLANGLVTVTFSVKYPGVEWSDKQPSVVWSSKKPGVEWSN